MNVIQNLEGQHRCRRNSDANASMSNMLKGECEIWSLTQNPFFKREIMQDDNANNNRAQEGEMSFD
jgi:hypothetical protein